MAATTANLLNRVSLAVLLGSSLASSACLSEPTPAPSPRGQTKLTLLHTADVHSRLFSYPLQIAQTDAALGLGTSGSIATVGGAARLAYLVGRERARSDRVLHLDGGDCFQGAPVFNFFDGEAEIRAMSTLGIDAQVLANHEFDKGALNVRNQLQKWATYPVLTANYKVEDPETLGSPDLDDVLQPFTTFNLRGLKVGVVGMGNLSSLSSLFEQPSRLGVTPLSTVDAAQAYIDLLRPLVDVIVFVTHLGLGADQDMIARTSGIDVVLGGHNHIVLQPPMSIDDCRAVDEQGRHYIELVSADGSGMTRRYCRSRPVVLAHSGAFSKYVGRLDLVTSNDRADLPADYDPIDGFEVIAREYQLFPVTADVPQDARMVGLLEPYQNRLDTLIDLDLLVGYAPTGARRFGTGGGDSALGNLISAAMWRRLGIETDFALTNTTGIRTDLVPGPVTVEQMFNIFPFDNSITKMQLSGVEIREMFDFVARRSAGRGCATQVQIAGARVVLDCATCTGREPQRCQKDSECPSYSCLGGKCAPSPCAEQIYIGYSEQSCTDDVACRPRCAAGLCAGTSAACASDADCAPLPNACDPIAGRCRIPIDPTGSYELATSTYLAQGGSGFVVLKRNTTQLDTKIQQRDALIDWVRGGKPCGWRADAPSADGLTACAVDGDCAALGDGFACGCSENAAEDAAGQCASKGPCGSGGRCVLAECRQRVSDFYAATCKAAQAAQAIAGCATSVSTCQLASEQCKYLACVDATVGSFTDGRVRMVGQ